MFDELFDSKRKILAAFHRFFTVDQDEMVEMITSGPKSNSKFKLDEIRRNEFFDPLIFNYLNLDTESVSMLKALICTTLGDSEGFEYIGREYNLSIASSTACKAILSNKVKKMQELLFSLDKGSLYSKSIVRILHGDIWAVKDFIVQKSIGHEDSSQQFEDKLTEIQKLVRCHTFESSEDIKNLFK